VNATEQIISLLRVTVCVRACVRLCWKWNVSKTWIYTLSIWRHEHWNDGI